MDGISGQTPVGAQQPIFQPTETEFKEAIDAVASLFGPDSSLQIDQNEGAGRVDDAKRKHNLRDIPELDEADAELLAAMKDVVEDLEALIALLTAEQDEKTLAATQKRIESLKSQIEQHHSTTMKKVNKSLDEMAKQEKAAKTNKILGWLGVAVACIAAAVMVCTVGGAVAGLAVVGALVGIMVQSLTEAGVMEKLVKAISDDLKAQHPNWSREACNAWAQGIVAGMGIALSLATIVGGGFASAGTGLLHVTRATMQMCRTVMTTANSVMAAAGIIGSTAGTVANYNAQGAQADVTETQKLLLELQTLLEQEQSDLEEILQKLQDAFGAVVDLLQSKQDALNEISQNLGV